MNDYDEAESIFPERLYLRVPEGLGRALDRAARQNHTTRSELVRQTLFRELSSRGVEFQPEPMVAA